MIDRPGTRTTDAQGYLSASWARRTPDRWSIEARGGLDRYTYHGQYLTESGDGGQSYYFTDTADSLDLTSELTLERSWARHTVTTGAEVRWNLRQDQTAHGLDGLELDDRSRSTTVGVYLQDEWKPSPRVLLNAGLRADRYATFGTTVNPRLALILTPREGTGIKLLGGRAFRAPSAYELRYFAAAGHRLDPESIWTGEAAWEQRAGPRAGFSASVFRYRVADLITEMESEDGSTPNGLVFVNGGSVTATGVEAEATWHSAAGVRLRLAHSMMQTRDEHGAPISNSPGYLTRAALVTPLPWGGLILAANGEIIASRWSPHGPAIAGGGLVNATLSRAAVWARATFACSVYNLFDSRYEDPTSQEFRQAGIRQNGRTVLARMTWAF